MMNVSRTFTLLVEHTPLENRNHTPKVNFSSRQSIWKESNRIGNHLRLVRGHSSTFRNRLLLYFCVTISHIDNRFFQKIKIIINGVACLDSNFNKMVMNPETFTEKTTQILTAAEALARDYEHVQIMPIHVSVALFEDEDALLKSIFQKMNHDEQVIGRSFMKQLVKVPTQHPAPEQSSFGSKTVTFLRNADQLRKKKKDSHLAVDHLIMAMWDDDEIARILKDVGCNQSQMQQVIDQIRGSRRIDSKSVDSTYESLSKYAIDMTLLAEQSKLDPVIGRDEEIRRVIRVLARRTKNNPVLIGNFD